VHAADDHRKVSVTGSGGMAATVVVIVRRGHVWVSIVPPFTWEAIMEPEKVDELITTLARARDAARKTRPRPTRDRIDGPRG
jgi:hypothetical protein